MKYRYAINLTAISLFAALTLLGFPKRYTEKIALTSSHRHAEISDEAVHTRFSMGGGPGFSNNGVPDRTGWIVADWSTQLPEPPAALTRYLVTFHITVFKGQPDEHAEQYCAYYTYDPATNRGYIRLPAKGEPHYSENTRMVFRGDTFEGPWFAATPDWTAAAETALKLFPPAGVQP